MNRMFLVLLSLVVFQTGRVTAQELFDDGTEPQYPQPATPIQREYQGELPDGSQFWYVPCDESDAPAIELLYRQLKANFNQGPVRHMAKKLEGAFLETRADVYDLKPLQELDCRYPAAATSWYANIQLNYAFALKDSNEFGITVPGGESRIIDSAKTTVIKRILFARLDWYADYQVLLVTVSDFPEDSSGPRFEYGDYFVTGRSVASTISSKSSVSSSFTTEVPKPGTTQPSKPKQTIEFSASSYKLETKNRIRVRVGTFEYALELGRFQATQWLRAGASEYDFNFDARWLTEANATFEETASDDYTECASTRGIKGKVSFSDLITGAGLSGSTDTKCKLEQSVLPMYVHWHVSPTRNSQSGDRNEGTLEGLYSSIRWNMVVNDDGTGTSFYQPRYYNYLTWRLHAYPREGSGGTIDVSPSQTAPALSKQFYPRIVK